MALPPGGGKVFPARPGHARRMADMPCSILESPRLGDDTVRCGTMAYEGYAIFHFGQSAFGKSMIECMWVSAHRGSDLIPSVQVGQCAMHMESSCNRIDTSIFIMPAKGPGELTGDECKLLEISSRLLAALHEWTERPPPESRWAFLEGKVEDKLVSTYHHCMVCIFTNKTM